MSGELYEINQSKMALAPVAISNLNTTAAYPRRKSAIGSADPTTHLEEFSLLRDRAIPLLLIVVGIVAKTSLVFFGKLPAQSISAALFVAAFESIVQLASILLGAYGLAAFLEVNFGSLPSTAIKLAGIALFCTAMGGWAATIDHDHLAIRGMVLALHVAILLYFTLIYSLFELDLQESLITTIVVGAMQGLVMVGMHVV